MNGVGIGGLAFLNSIHSTPFHHRFSAGFWGFSYHPAGPGWEETGLLFTWDDGTPLRPDYVSRRFSQLVKLSGLPKISFHGLRHSHVTALLAAGEAPKVVQETLGHHDPAYTMSVYQSVLPGMQSGAINRLADASKNIDAQ